MLDSRLPAHGWIGMRTRQGWEFRLTVREWGLQAETWTYTGMVMCLLLADFASQTLTEPQLGFKCDGLGCCTTVHSQKEARVGCQGQTTVHLWCTLSNQESQPLNMGGLLTFQKSGDQGTSAQLI